MIKKKICAQTSRKLFPFIVWLGGAVV